jgi:mono/diheme cytochrome c family protein
MHAKRIFAIVAVSTLLLGWSGTRVLAADTSAVKGDYMNFCARCHGPTGQGDGPAAASLSPRPRNFTDCATMKKISDDTLFKAIKNGGASVGLSASMPGWSTAFDDSEIKDLVTFIRGFCH